MMHSMRVPERQKRTAREWVRRMVKRGALDRRPCGACGAPEAEAHHEDYSRPLSVVWLCAAHHASLHRSERAYEPGQQVLWLLA